MKILGALKRDDISMEYEIQKDFEIDGTQRYFQFDGNKYELIGFIQKADEIDEIEARLNYWFSYTYDPSHL